MNRNLLKSAAMPAIGAPVEIKILAFLYRIGHVPDFENFITLTLLFRDVRCIHVGPGPSHQLASNRRALATASTIAQPQSAAVPVAACSVVNDRSRSRSRSRL